MPKITLTVSQDQVNELVSAFAEDGKLAEGDFEALATLALEEWSDTLLGKTRFRSMTELYAHWLREIFGRLLTDQDPDEKTLVTRLHLPYGQAAYIARVLREEDTVASRRRWLDKLELTLTKRLAEAKQWEKDGRSEEFMEFYMHKFARRELATIFCRLVEAGQAIRPIKIGAIIGDYCYVLICCADVEKIIKEIGKEKARLKI